MVPPALLRLHRHGLVHVLVIAPDRMRRLACAAEFHAASVLRGGPLITVDCVSEGALLSRALLGWAHHTVDAAGAHPLWAVAHGTLVLDRVTRLAADAQARLHDLLRRNRPTPGDGWGRLIVAADESPQRAVAEGRFSADLLDCLDKVRLDLTIHPARGAA